MKEKERKKERKRTKKGASDLNIRRLIILLHCFHKIGGKHLKSLRQRDGFELVKSVEKQTHTNKLWLTHIKEKNVGMIQML